MTFGDYAKKAAKAYKRYFHDRDHSDESLAAMEAIDDEMRERFGVFIQVRRMGDPAAALVIYGSRNAWRSNREPVSIIPFLSI